MRENKKPYYKLIALDLDGTLLTDDKLITDESKKWINYAVEQGVTVIFSTGRGLQTAGKLWNELGLDSPMVFVNGAEIWEGPGKLVERTFLPRDTVRRLHDIAIKNHMRLWGYSVESVTHLAEWTDDMFERDWLKIGLESDDTEKLAIIREDLTSWGTLEVTHSASTNLEISVNGISKASGVSKVCELLGITMSEVMSIGDSDNDLHLMRKAGLGVAMANGEAHVKSIADVITASNNENGVAVAIRKYVFRLE